MISVLRHMHPAKLLLALLILTLPVQAADRKRVKAKQNVAVAEPENPLYTPQEETMLEGVERVLVFDSLVVRKADLLSALPLPDDAGRLEWIDADAPEKGTRYVSGFGDACYEGCATDSLNPLAMKKHLRFGKEWNEGEFLFDRDTNASDEADESGTATCQSYAYMLADGSTLYLAQKSPDGLGGLDIYMTRQGGDGRSFFRPENIGMPYNSTANDYLMIINEEAGVGYFASDRNQGADSVCVYYFRPSTMHETYNCETYSLEQRLSLGRLTSISDTWTQDGEATRLREDFGAYRQKLENSLHKRLTANDAQQQERLSQEEQERTLQNLRCQWHEGNHSEPLRELIMELEERVIQQRKALRR